MMLIDKGYYDYDYKEIEKEEPIVTYNSKQGAEQKTLLAKFGIGNQSTTAEQLQQQVMNDITKL